MFGGEIQLVFRKKPLSLRYKALHPRWGLIAQYGHISDDDAVADIDPHAGFVSSKVGVMKSFHIHHCCLV